MKNSIFIEKQIPLEVENRIKKNLRKINNSLIDLTEMGYTMYLTPNNLHVCDGMSHNEKAEADQSVIVASILVFNIDAGDW